MQPGKSRPAGRPRNLSLTTSPSNYLAGRILTVVATPIISKGVPGGIRIRRNRLREEGRAGGRQAQAPQAPQARVPRAGRGRSGKAGRALETRPDLALARGRISRQRGHERIGRDHMPGRLHPGEGPAQAGRLLLRPALAVAARVQREHKRAAEAVLPEGHRPERLPRGVPRRGGRGAQRQAAQDAGVAQAGDGGNIVKEPVRYASGYVGRLISPGSRRESRIPRRACGRRRARSRRPRQETRARGSAPWDSTPPCRADAAG